MRDVVVAALLHLEVAQGCEPSTLRVDGDGLSLWMEGEASVDVDVHGLASVFFGRRVLATVRLEGFQVSGWDAWNCGEPDFTYFVRAVGRRRRADGAQLIRRALK